MQDSDDPCDDVVTNNLDGWIRSDSSRSGETNSRQRLERDIRSGYQNSWARFEHG
jgi:hypothetical protein